MNFKRTLAAVAAGALAVSALAVSAFALETKIESVKLDGDESDGSKTVQWDLHLFDVGAIDTIEVYGTVPANDDGWIGGGGGLGYDAIDKWIQVDFAMDSAFVTLNEDGTFVATLDFSTLCDNRAVNLDKADGLVQLGWWWGSGDGTMTLTDIKVNGTSIMGTTYPATTDGATDGAADGATDAVVGDTNVATDGASKDAADTGIEGVAAVAGLALVAAGAILVAKRK